MTLASLKTLWPCSTLGIETQTGLQALQPLPPVSSHLSLLWPVHTVCPFLCVLPVCPSVTSHTSYLDLGQTLQVKGTTSTRLSSLQTLHIIWGSPCHLHFWLAGYKFGGSHYPPKFSNFHQWLTELRKCHTYDYSLIIAKGYKSEPADGKNLQSKIWEGHRDDTSIVLSPGSQFAFYTSGWDNMQIIAKQEPHLSSDVWSFCGSSIIKA